MLYAIILIGSFMGICALLGARVLLKQRTIRRFVRSVRQRFESAEERGSMFAEETNIPRPRKNPRTSAIELQQVRTFTRSAEKALSQNKTEEAERLFIQALTIHPHAYDVSAQLAKLYLTTGRESKAEAMYRELLQNCDDVSFHANLGLAYYKQEKYVDACYAYQEALNRDPKNPERSSALGRACIAAHRFEEAVPLLEKATAFLTRNTELLHMLAESYLQLNQRDKAEETYQRINKLEPYNEEVKAKMNSIREMENAAAGV